MILAQTFFSVESVGATLDAPAGTDHWISSMVAIVGMMIVFLAANMIVTMKVQRIRFVWAVLISEWLVAVSALGTISYATTQTGPVGLLNKSLIIIPAILIILSSIISLISSYRKIPGFRKLLFLLLQLLLIFVIITRVWSLRFWMGLN